MWKERPEDIMTQDTGKWDVGHSDNCLRELILTASLCHWMVIAFLYVKQNDGTVSLSDSSL